MRIILGWPAYVLPIGLFLALTSVEGRVGPGVYPALYCAKTALIAAMLVALARAGSYRELTPSWRALAATLPLGILLCAMWVIVDDHTPHFPFLGSRAGFDPWTGISGAPERAAFLVVRFIGLAAVVPVMEELFFRSFLLRFVIDPDFRRVPIGTYEPLSCAAVIILMAMAHPEWLAAALFSLAMNGLIYRTKSVWTCVAAHGWTNLFLGLYVVATHTWRFW